MKGTKISDETRKEIYERIAAGDKIADIAAVYRRGCQYTAKNAAAGRQNTRHRSGGKECTERLPGGLGSYKVLGIKRA